MKITIKLLLTVVCTGLLVTSNITAISVANDFRHVHVAFVSDENYPMPTCIAMSSIIKQSSHMERLHFHIIDLGIKPIDKQRISDLRSHGDFDLEFIEFNRSSLNRFQSYFWSPAIYAKLLLSDMLPNINKLILIDGDTLAARNLRTLYDIDLKDNYIGIINNYSFTNYNYCKWMRRVNAGVILMDLEKMRRDNLISKFFTCLDNGQRNLEKLPRDGGVKRTFTEEHTLQEVCAGHILDLPVRYNFLNYMIYTAYDGHVPEYLKNNNKSNAQATYILNELENVVVYHLSDMPKLWNMNEGEWYSKKRSKYIRDLWYSYYSRTSYAGKSF